MANDEHGVKALGGLTWLSLSHLAEFSGHLSWQPLDPMSERTLSQSYFSEALGENPPQSDQTEEGFS